MASIKSFPLSSDFKRDIFSKTLTEFSTHTNTKEFNKDNVDLFVYRLDVHLRESGLKLKTTKFVSWTIAMNDPETKELWRKIASLVEIQPNVIRGYSCKEVYNMFKGIVPSEYDGKSKIPRPFNTK